MLAVGVTYISFMHALPVMTATVQAIGKQLRV
jgi:hypothetical protein